MLKIGLNRDPQGNENYVREISNHDTQVQRVARLRDLRCRLWFHIVTS